MLSVDEAQQAVLMAVGSLPAARVSLLDSLGLVLAEDIAADMDSPPFDNSAVDGYAVVAADTARASAISPVVLRELPGVMAGGVPAETVTSGTCMRVMTGAPMPAGADAMVMREDAREADGGIAILLPAHSGDHIRRRGEAVRAGTRVLEAGVRISAAEVGMLAMAGAAEPLCVRRPRVAVFSTGDELVDPSSMPGPGQIRDSNRFSLASLVAESGAALHSMRHIPDDLDATIQMLRECAGMAGERPTPSPSPSQGEGSPSPQWGADDFTSLRSVNSPPSRGAPSLRRRGLGEVDRRAPSLRMRRLGEVPSLPADVIVTSGGVSVGDRDFVKPALESIGRLDLWRVRMKPGKPVAFGRIPRPDGGETLFFGLPGNPVSTMVTFELFVRPALWKLAGRRDLARPRISARLTEPVDHRPGRQEFIRATVVHRDGEWHAWPTGAQGSHHLGSMLNANALIVASAEEGDLAQGALADALLLGIDPASLD
jgi:molybdopterin molybdotransferase